MIWHIVKKDFLDNFTSARFVAGFLICLLLVPYTVYTGTKVYENRVNLYQQDLKKANEIFTRAQVFAAVQPEVNIPPSPLMIFCKGISEQVGSQVNLGSYEVPTFAGGISGIHENQFLNRFVSMDFINILAIILSLIGVFLSYDIFTREKENGTLRLLLSNRVTRADFFLGKAGGILLTFVPLMLICYMLVFIILWVSPMVSLSVDDYTRILLLFLFSLLYLALFVFLGSFVSSKSASSSTSLIISLFIWCLLLFLLPGTMAYLGRNIVKNENYGIVKLNMGDLEGEYWKKYGEIWKEVEKETGTYEHNCNVCSDYMMLFTPMEHTDFRRRMNTRTGPLELEYASKKWHLQEAYLNQLYHQQKMIKYLSCFSPSEILKYVAASLCRSDMENHIDFMDQARNYRDLFYNYFKEHKMYSSFEYFTPQKESDIPKTQEEGNKQYEQWRLSAKPQSTFDFSSMGTINTAALPRFTYKEKSIMSGLSDQLWLLTGMILACIVLIWITYRSFIRYDIR